jgi:hypothetical protein
MINEREFTVESSTSPEYGTPQSSSMRSRTELCLEHAVFLSAASLVVYFINTHTFVAPNLACGEARGKECIRSDTRLTEQRSHRPNSEQPSGRRVFWTEASLLPLYRSTAGYARRSRLASAKNPLPRACAFYEMDHLGCHDFGGNFFSSGRIPLSRA